MRLQLKKRQRKTQTKRAFSEDTDKKMVVPSLIGIQAVHEALNTAKTEGVLNPEQISPYLKLQDEWKDSKGNPGVKIE